MFLLTKAKPVWYSIHAMAHDTQAPSYSPDALASLGAELSRIGKALINVSVKMQKLTGPKLVTVSKETDPDMFTKEFKEAVSKSLDDIQHGRLIPYDQVRQELGL